MIPDPLHPAIVHFPIVLTIVGCVAAVLALFWRRGHLPQWTALLLILGAASAGVAYLTGDHEKELVGVLTKPAEQLLDAHETWGEITLICSIAAALAALAAVLVRWPRLGVWLRAMTAISAVATLVAVIQTGHRGGSMVYQQGVGINSPLQAGSDTANIEGTSGPQARNKDE